MTTSVPTTKPPGSGWRPWMFQGEKSPFDYVEVELWREGWLETIVQSPSANPLANAVWLWWRPAGLELTPQQKISSLFGKARR
jgi:hypothetical protein